MQNVITGDNLKQPWPNFNNEYHNHYEEKHTVVYSSDNNKISFGLIILVVPEHSVFISKCS
jgi:hypothetical protein